VFEVGYVIVPDATETVNAVLDAADTVQTTFNAI